MAYRQVAAVRATIWHNPRCPKSRETLAILDAMVADPILIERPLVETGKGVVLARPPERVRDIL